MRRERHLPFSDVALAPTDPRPRPRPRQNLNLVIINSEVISGWQPKNTMWPTFRSNAQMLTNGLDPQRSNKGHLLKADNDEGIRAAFKKVAAMMGGLNEAL